MWRENLLHSPSPHKAKPGEKESGGILRNFQFTPYYAYTQYVHHGINSGGCNGGGITGVFPLNHWLGAVVDVSGCKISINAPNLSGDSLTYLIGPRFSYQPSARWNLYLDLLVGGSSVNVERIFPLSHHLDDPDEWLNLPLYHHYDEVAKVAGANVFASAIGGGVDVKLKRGLALRIVNVQYTHTPSTSSCRATILEPFGLRQVSS
ncbi:MAG: hypothetical protein U0V70_14025 [Terriglobia bacterium]